MKTGHFVYYVMIPESYILAGLHWLDQWVKVGAASLFPGWGRNPSSPASPIAILSGLKNHRKLIQHSSFFSFSVSSLTHISWLYLYLVSIISDPLITWSSTSRMRLFDYHLLCSNLPFLACYCSYAVIRLIDHRDTWYRI